MDKIKEIIENINVKEISEHIKWMVENTPYRLADSDDERKAADYIAYNLREYGLEVDINKFKAFNSFPEYSYFEVLEPVSIKMDSLPCGHIESTDKNGEELELIYVSNGGYDDYKERNVSGKAVLVEVSYAPAVPEKARIAWEKGARAIVCMNWGSGQDVICHRALKSVWGNPTEDTIKKIPELIGVGVTQNDGIRLKDLCSKYESVKVRIAAISPSKWSQVCQPKGILRGNRESDEIILVGSHIDAWKPGVTCNATGNATTLQIAKVLCKYRDDMKRDVWFVFWNGHEIAEAAGSTWLVDNFWDELNKKCVAYFNIDSTGMGEATLYEIKTSDEYREFAVDNAKNLIDEELRVQRLTKIGDQSFMGIGIPGTAQRMSYTKDYMEHNCGATLGWWNHTKEDGYDKYSPENILKDTKVLTSLIYRLSSAQLLPYDFTEKLSDIQNKAEELKVRFERVFPMQDLTDNIKDAKKLVKEIQMIRDKLGNDKAERYNKYVIIVSRLLTNVFQTYADKYDQDSYGYSKLSYSIPLLADLYRLEKLDADGLEYGMIHTQLIKNKNRINDALYMIIEISKLYKEILS